MLLLTFLAAYGAAVGGVDVQNTMAQIIGPWPTIGTASCSFSQSGPSAGCNVLDTFLLGGTWLLASFGSLLFRVGAVFFLLYQLFNIVGAVNGIPFFFGFIALIQLIIGFYGYSLLRQGNHGFGGGA